MKFWGKFKVPDGTILGKFEITVAQIRRFSYKWSLIILRKHITVQMDSIPWNSEKSNNPVHTYVCVRAYSV